MDAEGKRVLDWRGFEWSFAANCATPFHSCTWIPLVFFFSQEIFNCGIVLPLSWGFEDFFFCCFRFYKTRWRFSNRKGKLAGTETNNIEILFWQVLISKLLHAARLLEFTAGQQAGALEILSACSPRFSFMHCSICKMKYGLLKIFSLLYNLLFKEESLSNSRFWHCLIFNSAG